MSECFVALHFKDKTLHEKRIIIPHTVRTVRFPTQNRLALGDEGSDNAPLLCKDKNMHCINVGSFIRQK